VFLYVRQSGWDRDTERVSQTSEVSSVFTNTTGRSDKSFGPLVLGFWFLGSGQESDTGWHVPANICRPRHPPHRHLKGGVRKVSGSVFSLESPVGVWVFFFMLCSYPGVDNKGTYRNGERLCLGTSWRLRLSMGGGACASGVSCVSAVPTSGMVLWRRRSGLLCRSVIRITSDTIDNRLATPCGWPVISLLWCRRQRGGDARPRRLLLGLVFAPMAFRSTDRCAGR